MFRLQRFTQQGIVHEVNLTDGQIIGCPPPRVDLHELGGSQRITITSASFSFRQAHRRLLSSGSSQLIVHIPMQLACYASCSARSEEHTSELQSRGHLVCRLLLEKKNKPTDPNWKRNEDRRWEVRSIASENRTSVASRTDAAASTN